MNNSLKLSADQIKDTFGEIKAHEAIIQAVNGIGDKDNPLSLVVNRLDVSNTGNGDIYISNKGELNLVDLNQDGKAVINTGQGSIETHSPLNINSDISLSGDFTLSANSSDSENDHLTINANITNDLGGTIKIQAGDNVIQQAGIILNKTGNISLLSDKGSIVQSGGSVETERLSFDAENSVDYQGENNVIEVLAATVEKGNFSFTEKDTIAIDQVKAGGSIKISAGNIIDHSDDTDIDIQSNERIELIAFNSIGGDEKEDSYLEFADNSIVKATTKAEGVIQLSGLGDLQLEEVSSTKGSIDIKAIGDIVVSTIKTQDEDNTVTINSTQGSVEIGSISSDDNVSIVAGDGDVIVESIVTKKGINLKSDSGAIKKSKPESKIKAETLTVASKTGIDLLTDTSQIDAFVLGAGDIEINEINNVIINTMTTFEGSIKVNSGGHLEALDVRAIDGDVVIDSQGDLIAKNISATKRSHSADIHDVSLSTTGGNMIIDLVVADDTIVINVENGELIDDNDTDIDMKANSITGNVNTLKNIDFDASSITLISDNMISIAYLDYLIPKEKELTFPDHLFEPVVDEKEIMHYFDEQVTILSTPDDILNAAHVDFNLQALIDVEQLSDYDVKWVYDKSGALEDSYIEFTQEEVHIKKESVPDSEEGVEKTETEPSSKETQTHKEEGKKEQESQESSKKNTSLRKIYDNNRLIESEPTHIPNTILYNKDFDQSKTTTTYDQKNRIDMQQPVFKHVTKDELSPKKGFMGKVKAFLGLKDQGYVI